MAKWSPLSDLNLRPHPNPTHLRRGHVVGFVSNHGRLTPASVNAVTYNGLLIQPLDYEGEVPEDRPWYIPTDQVTQIPQ